jgi:hypothetical protein
MLFVLMALLTVGSYTGYECDLLSSRRKEHKDEDDLLNAAAHVAVLGGGFADDQFPTQIAKYHR